MKSVITYINEKLILNKNIKTKYKYHPKTKEELQYLLKQLIEERGNEGNFNDIYTSEITDMSFLFASTETFNGDISEWNVSNVTNMTYMFYGCTSFNQDISNWDVSKVEGMLGMFSMCESFNQPLYNWNVSNVTDMMYMFRNCRSFNQDISSWDVSKVKNNTNTMFKNCPIEKKYKPKFKK